MSGATLTDVSKRIAARLGIQPALDAAATQPTQPTQPTQELRCRA